MSEGGLATSAERELGRAFLVLFTEELKGLCLSHSKWFARLRLVSYCLPNTLFLTLGICCE